MLFDDIINLYSVYQPFLYLNINHALKGWFHIAELLEEGSFKDGNALLIP